MLVPMRKARLTFLKSDKKAMLESLQKGAHIMIIEPENPTNKPDERLNIKTQESEAMLKLLNNYSKKPGFFTAKPTIGYQEFSKTNLKGEALTQQIAQISEEITAHQTKISELEADNQRLRPWAGVGQALDNIKDTSYVIIEPGYLQPENIDPIKDYLQETGQEIQILETVPDGIACLVFIFKSQSNEVIQELHKLGFKDTTLPKTTEPPLNIIRRNNGEISKLKESIKSSQEKLNQLGQERENLEIYIQQEVSKEKRINAPVFETIDTVTIEGWVRHDRVIEFKNDIRNVTDIYDLELRKPNKDEIPPTVTKNNFFLAQFETITDAFSLPRFNSIDPAPVAGPWYWIIYGMMMGDAGYGLVMALSLFIFIRIKKPEGDFGRLVHVLYYSSFTTIIWGIIFGSYFGETFHPLLFNPLEAPMYMLIFSLIIGTLQLFSGMIIKIYMDYKEGHIIDGILDQGTWIVLITGLGFLFIPSLFLAGEIMAIISAIIIFLTAGRKKPTIIGKIVGGFLGLYDVTSYMSDILSYSRILALGLATSVVGMVMNLLAGMIATNIIGYIFAALIFIVGHVFNIVLSMLSAYVHDSRLQYIEFFNKFYEGGGLPFKPLEFDQRYVDISGADISQGSNAVSGNLQ